MDFEKDHRESQNLIGRENVQISFSFSLFHVHYCIWYLILVVHIMYAQNQKFHSTSDSVLKFALYHFKLSIKCIIGIVTSGALFSHGICTELSRNCGGRVNVKSIDILSCNKRKVIITL